MASVSFQLVVNCLLITEREPVNRGKSTQVSVVFKLLLLALTVTLLMLDHKVNL